MYLSFTCCLRSLLKRMPSPYPWQRSLGYTNHEINRLYITATTIVVVLSLILTIPLANITIEEICKAAFAQFSGWLPYYVPEITFVKMFAAGVIAYALVAFFQIRKVERIPMTDALKNVE